MTGYAPRIAIAGATGAVGAEFIRLIEERNLPFSSLRLMASSRSAGRRLVARGREIEVEDLDRADPSGLDLAFFSAGAERSRRHAPRFAEAGAWVVDNSSAFRMDEDKALVVPEINGNLLDTVKPRIIANPNCSTIIALMPLAALDRAFGLERALVTTYQAVSGAGRSALDELNAQTRAAAEGRIPEARVFSRPIVHNLIPVIGDEDASGFTTEELKVTKEGRKILGRPDLPISATAVRVPVKRCHSMAIWVRLAGDATREAFIARLKEAPGVDVPDTPPGPADLAGRDPVFVGRIRKDPHEARSFWFWAVSDQLRKGAALNAIQIGEELLARNRVEGAGS